MSTTIKKNLQKNIESKIHSNAVQTFALLMRSFKECSDEVQDGILSMIDILDDPETDEDDRGMAFRTIEEALFPNFHNEHYGVDLEELEAEERENPELAAIHEQMDEEEDVFAALVQSLMDKKGMTQSDLARASGVGQSAISMMLTRNCRPQMKTVEKIARALEVTPSELWES